MISAAATVAGGISAASSPSHSVLYTVPASSSWFRWNDIDEREKKGLPEFFESYGSMGRNARVYKEYRDFIINKYRENPARRLAFTDVRKALVADVSLLHKVFSFLDSHGLINFSAPKSPPLHQSGVSVVVESGPIDVHVVPPIPASFTDDRKVAASRGRNGVGAQDLSPLTSFLDVFGEWTPDSAGSMACGFCGTGCAAGKYESTESGFIVCSECSRRHNIGEVSVDTIDNKETRDAPTKNPWTDSETLLLLEGVLKYGDDWDLISQHVHMRNKSDCIAKLIQLPFGDKVLGSIHRKSDSNISFSKVHNVKLDQVDNAKMPKDDKLEEPKEPVESDAQAQGELNTSAQEQPTKERPLKQRRLFSSSSATDSLLNQVALLSALVDPHVAASAAHAAIVALCKEGSNAKDAFDTNEVENVNRLNSSSHAVQSNSKLDDQVADIDDQEDKAAPKIEDNFVKIAYHTRAAVATAIGAAAARAKLLADQEEREMEVLMASIIESQMRKLQYKMKHFEELESMLEQEYVFIQQEKAWAMRKWTMLIQQCAVMGLVACASCGILPH